MVGVSAAGVHERSAARVGSRSESGKRRDRTKFVDDVDDI
jgi:hypothetical protein